MWKRPYRLLLVTLVLIAMATLFCGSVFGATVTIQFDGNGDGASNPESISVEAGEYITLPTPTWVGHTFSHWVQYVHSPTNGYGDKYGTGGDRYKATKSLTMRAVWVPKVTIQFDGNGDGASNPASITVDTGTYITLPTPTWSGHKFVAWYSNVNSPTYGYGTKYGTGGDRVKVTASVTMKAVWVPKYTISFDGNGDGASNPAPITVDSGTYITLPTPTMEGYVFSHWCQYVNSPTYGYGDKYGTGGDRYKVTGSLTMKAVWIPKGTITFDGNSPDVKSIVKSEAKGTYITFPTVTREKYDLLYWTSSKDGQSGTKYYPGDQYCVGDSTTFYAQWKKKTYTIAFNANGGGAVSEMKVPMDNSLTLPKTSQFGYIFNGWYLGNTYIGGVGDTYTPTASVTLTAKWEEIPFTTYLLFGAGGLGLIILIVLGIGFIRRH